MPYHISFDTESLERCKQSLLSLAVKIAGVDVASGVASIFEGIEHSVPAASDRIVSLARHVEIVTKTDTPFVGELGKIWLGLAGDMVMSKRDDEVVEIAREAALASQDGRHFCRVASTCWADTVQAIFRREPEKAKGMIVIAQAFASEYDRSFKQTILHTRAALDLPKGSLKSVAGHTSSVHFRHASHLRS